MLAVPAIFFVGYLAGGVAQAGVRGPLYCSSYSLPQYLLVVAQVFAFFYLTPLVVAAALGTVLAMGTTRRQQ